MKDTLIALVCLFRLTNLRPEPDPRVHVSVYRYRDEFENTYPVLDSYLYLIRGRYSVYTSYWWDGSSSIFLGVHTNDLLLTYSPSPRDFNSPSLELTYTIPIGKR